MNIDFIVAEVSRLKPGERITFNGFELDLIRDHPMSDLVCPIVSGTGVATELKDRVREKIVGSAYDMLAYEEPITRNLTFERLKKPLEDGRLCYCSPDKRHLYTFDGTFWNRNEEAIKEYYAQRDKTDS